MRVIKPLTSHSIVADFLQVYRETIGQEKFDGIMMTEKTTPSRILFLRPSQLPYCPVATFVNVAQRGLYRQMNLAGAFYTKVGTIVHEVMQSYLCQHSGRFLANYKCLECGTWHKFSFKNECCDFPTQYHEIEIDYRGVKGHIDAVYKDKKGRLWILDFKTTSLNLYPKKKKDPGVTYREQIEVYAVLFELQYGKRIEGIMDAFILRDNPKTDPAIWARPLTDAKRKEVMTRLKTYKKMHRETMDASTLDQALALVDYGKCANEFCPVCTDYRIKTKKDMQALVKRVHKTGVAQGYIPIRAFAEKALAKNASRR